MQAVKGYISSGRFTPTDGTVLTDHAHAVLVINDINTNPQQKKSTEDFLSELSKLAKEAKEEERQARKEWLARLRQARQLAAGEPLPDFPPRTLMGDPHGLTD